MIISGGIAAYKTLEIIRCLRDAKASVRCVLTKGGAQFVTPLSLAALSSNRVYQDLFSSVDESDMSHIQLSRDADLLVVAPATANIIAKMATGIADDLATTLLLATDKPVLIAPGMNVRMWEHPATVANLAVLKAYGIHRIGPNKGNMACGEYGFGRMAEPDEIVAAIIAKFDRSNRLAGRHVLVTSGPTHESIDPIRYMTNHSSGKQGHAIAVALAHLGARVTLISGPVSLSDPTGVNVVHVLSARDMMAACEKALPADVIVCAAAVADWRVVKASSLKIKKQSNKNPPLLKITENPDILARLSTSGAQRALLVIGFAAETDSVIDNARAKLTRKNCDWIIANDVSSFNGSFGSDLNKVSLITQSNTENWPRMSKINIAKRLAERIATALEATP